MSSSATPQPAVSAKAKALQGVATVPGDKSISHRSLIFGALAVGETTVTGLLEGEDVLRTATAMEALGAKVERTPGVKTRIWGRGIGGLREPADVIDMGNSGTSARLIAGLLSAYPFTSFMTGDASLRRRPMARVIAPLSMTGAKFVSREGGRLPLAITGTPIPMPLNYASPVASAQVKSAVLLAGLHAPGTTVVTEPSLSRDHTERMLRYFGAQVETSGTTVKLVGQPELTGKNLIVPADPSSAAFLVVAALLVPGSHVTITNVGTNPLRTGLFDTLKEMGASLVFKNERMECGEPVADLEVKHSALKGVTVPASRAPSMIDEYPVLAMAAACASGDTRMEGLSELRVKESDRLTAIAEGLSKVGITSKVDGDTLTVTGGKAKGSSSPIAVNLDHRMAMSFLVLGMVSDGSITVDDASPIATSFPGFAALMNKLGADISGAP